MDILECKLIYLTLAFHSNHCIVPWFLEECCKPYHSWVKVAKLVSLGHRLHGMRHEASGDTGRMSTWVRVVVLKWRRGQLLLLLCLVAICQQCLQPLYPLGHGLLHPNMRKSPQTPFCRNARLVLVVQSCWLSGLRADCS